MPKSFHFPDEVRSFSLGVNASLDKEIVGRKDGEYLGARNMRPNSYDDFGILKTINGEQLLYPSEDNSCQNHYVSVGQNFATASWRCKAAIDVLVEGEPTIVELWADANENCDPFIRVGGKIVCASADLPINNAYDIQIDTSDTQDGCEIFFTNNHDAPMYFDIYDMLLNSGETIGGQTGECTEKYFNDFSVSNSLLQLQGSIHHPMFWSLTDNAEYPNADIFNPPSGNPGLKVGQYCYRVRYTNKSGDKTGFCIPTPLIPVVYYRKDSDYSTKYPYEKNTGEGKGIQSPYGIVLKIRIENRNNYEYLEITRVSYTGGLALGTTPTEIIVGKISLSDGEISIHTIVDFGGDEGSITLEDQAETFSSIDTCQSIRYFNNILHLGNVRYASKEISDSILDGSEVFPILHNMGTEGHSDPYHHTYHKNYMGGEQYGFALIGFDSNFGRSFALPIEASYEMPNRRDAMSAMSEYYSFGVVPRGCDIGNNDNTAIFERFSHANSVEKTTTLPRSIKDGEYTPMRPIAYDDTSLELDSIVNISVKTGEPLIPDTAYSPKAFAPEMYSLGLAISNLDISKFPSWVTCFTVVRTSPAGKVKFQGLGFYDITDTQEKSLNKVSFYSPEIDSLSGLIDPTQVSFDNLKAVPVAPYGFFSEVYGQAAGGGADQISYATIIKDNGTINIDGDDDGINGHVGFGKWRNSTTPAWVDGDYTEFGIESITEYSGDKLAPRTSGNTVDGEFYTLETDADIYLTDTTNDSEYVDAGVKDFHEPLYLFNIINPNSVVPQRVVMDYFDTGSFFKIKSCIGVYNGTQTEYPLVDERWEDCIPYKEPGYTFSDRNTFVYINGQKWWNVTFKDQSTLDDFLTAYQLNGYYDIPSTNDRVYGVYTHVYTDENDIKIVFGKEINDVVFNPSVGSEIWVYFDKGMPVRVFGGDTYVGNALFSPIDTYILNPFTGVFVSLGLPYTRYNQHSSINACTDAPNGTFVAGQTIVTDVIRQLLVTFVCETRVQLNYGYEIPQETDAMPVMSKFFPVTNYIMRPEFWDTGNLNNNFAGSGGGISETYAIDYPKESNWWQYGGFRYRPQHNIDYYHNANFINYTSKPSVGYRDKTQYRTRVAYSLERVMNVQDSPNIRTFLSGNYRDISDVNGEIKYLYDSLGSRGNNIYAITDHGICLLLIGKNILSQADGVELATMIGTQGTYIGGEIWLSNTVGMPLQTWRSAKEGDDMLFFANKDSVFMFAGDKIDDIGRRMFHPRLLRYLSVINNGHLTAGYDGLNKEYWLQIDGTTFAYCPITEHWNDKYDYKFDRYVHFNNRVFGIGSFYDAGATAYEITGEGNIGGQPIVNEVWGICLPEQGYPATPVPHITGKEFVRVRINSDSKPDEMGFYEQYGGQIQAQLLEENFKDYTNFEQYIPRRLESADSERKRMQGRSLIWKITKTGNFILREISIQYKELK